MPNKSDELWGVLRGIAHHSDSFMCMRCVCCTGTIMPNKHEELWGVLNCLAPGCLGDYKGFADYYSKPIRKGQSRTALPHEVKKVRGAECPVR